MLSKNCVERDYSLISLVLAMVKLVNMSCDYMFSAEGLFSGWRLPEIATGLEFNL